MTSIPDFAERRRVWSSPPVDDVGYLSSKDLLTWDDEALVDLISGMEKTRYRGWRNYRGNWRRLMGLDKTENKDILDYGCGVGIEALQYARLGNRIWLADISLENTELAARVLQLHGFRAEDCLWISSEVSEVTPWLIPKDWIFDVVHCAGVLHHIPDPIPVVRSIHRALRNGGELRLMLYSDEAWRIATKTEPPEGDVFDYVEFDAFWQFWDPIGGYADWYDRAKLEARFGSWFEVKHCEPITKDGAYIGAVLVRR